MWTPRHRTRHETRLKDVVVQASLDEVARFLERADPPARPNAQPVRLVMAAIAWHLRTGGAWRDLPAGFPPWRRVYGWFRRWIEKSLFEALMRAAHPRPPGAFLRRRRHHAAWARAAAHADRAAGPRRRSPPRPTGGLAARLSRGRPGFGLLEAHPADLRGI